jgi:phosphoglycolate phosphatase
VISDARGTVIFDLDGTLVDSAPDLADALDRLLVELGFAPVGLEGTRALIGHGIPALVRGALAREGRVPDEAEVAPIQERFLHLYAGGLSVRTRPYAGAAEALASLRRAGWRLVVCTNKREAFSRAILEDLGLLPQFELVAGPDTFGVAKPNPAHLTRTLPEPAGGDHKAVVVGDSAVDVEAARAAGLPVIVVAWGYARRPVLELGADKVAESFDQVPALVEALAGAARLRPPA